MWLRRSAAVLFAVVLLIGAGGQAAQAQSNQTFTIPAGGRANVNFEGFCIDFGGSFPRALRAPSERVSNDLRGALAYIQSNGLSGTTAKAVQAEYGIWRVAGARGSPRGDATADAVVNARGNVPADPQNATSILDAARAGRVSLETISWGSVGAPVDIAGARDNFYGRGTLVVRNLSGQQLTLFMPIGTLFLPGASGSQRVGAYQIGTAQILTGSLPNTAALDMRLMAAALTLGLALPIHLWRRRREGLIGTRRAI